MLKENLPDMIEKPHFNGYSKSQLTQFKSHGTIICNLKLYLWNIFGWRFLAGEIKSNGPSQSTLFLGGGKKSYH